MSKNSTLEKYRQKLFDPNSTLSLTKAEEQRLVRMRDVYVQWLEDPLLTRVQMRDYIIANHTGISISQVYRDINDIYILLGNVQNASRAHIQYIVNETLIATIHELKGNKKNYKELIQAIDKLAKYNQLDRDAAEPVNWGEMVDFNVEPTSDPSVLGIEPVQNLEELKAKLMKRYAEDIDYEVVKKAQDGENS